MSLLYVFATRDSVVMVGDYRRYMMKGPAEIDGQFNFDAVEGYMDNAPKAYKANNNFIIGCVGHCIPVLDELIKLIAKSTIMSFEGAFRTVKEFMDFHRPNMKRFKTAVIIGGLTASRKTVISIFRTDREESENVFNPQEIVYVGTCAGMNPEQWIDRRIEGITGTKDELEILCHDLAEYVSSHDWLVSKKHNVFSLAVS